MEVRPMTQEEYESFAFKCWWAINYRGKFGNVGAMEAAFKEIAYAAFQAGENQAHNDLGSF